MNSFARAGTEAMLKVSPSHVEPSQSPKQWCCAIATPECSTQGNKFTFFQPGGAAGSRSVSTKLTGLHTEIGISGDRAQFFQHSWLCIQAKWPHPKYQ